MARRNGLDSPGTVLAVACLVAACHSHFHQASDVSLTAAAPPIATARHHRIESPNGAREDDYYWLRDDTRWNPEMLGYLKAENAYADATLAHTRPLQEQLYQEIVGRIKQDDATVPFRKRGYWYYR